MARSQAADVRDASGPNSAHGIGMDDLFDALGSRWRRRAVRRLAERSVAETTEAFVASLVSEHARTTEDASSVRTAFRHAHLPKLAALDIVDYDREGGDVAPGPNLEEAASCLSAIEDTRTRLRQ